MREQTQEKVPKAEEQHRCALKGSVDKVTFGRPDIRQQ